MTWTIPNLLSVIRVIAAPCVAMCFAIFERPQADQIAVLIFVGAAATDYLDGVLARSLGQESAFGRMLDPVADKAMVTIALALIMALYNLEWQVMVPAALIMLREVLVSGLREFLGDVKLPVTRIAKWKTTLQMFAIMLLLLHGAIIPVEGAGPSHPIIAKLQGYAASGIGAIGILLLWLAFWLTVVTGFDYFAKALPYIRAKGATAPVIEPEPGE